MSNIKVSQLDSIGASIDETGEIPVSQVVSPGIKASYKATIQYIANFLFGGILTTGESVETQMGPSEIFVIGEGKGLSTPAGSGELPHKLQVIGNETTPTVSIGNVGEGGGNSGLHLFAARGTVEAPTALMQGDYITSTGIRQWGTTKLQRSSGADSWISGGNVTDTSQPVYRVIQTNAANNDINSLPRSNTYLLGTDGGFTASATPAKINADGTYDSPYKYNMLNGGLLNSGQLVNGAAGTSFGLYSLHSDAGNRNWEVSTSYDAMGDYVIRVSAAKDGNPNAIDGITALRLSPDGAIGTGHIDAPGDAGAVKIGKSTTGSYVASGNHLIIEIDGVKRYIELKDPV